MGDVLSKDFLWGASTSGHQVEGGNYDQWTVWEKAHAEELAKNAEKRFRKLPAWQKINNPKEASEPANYVSGKGVDHFHRYKEDFEILKQLNLKAFRFTLEWSRLEPEEGAWNQTAIDHYHNYLAEMRRQGIEPILNLWHWTHPVWLEEKGGFGKKANIGYFLRFVQKVADEYGADLKYVITINEPNVYVSYSELNGGISVPPEASKVTRLCMFFNLVKAHRMSYLLLKQSNPDLKVGAAVQMANNLKKTDKWLSTIAVKVADKFGNYIFYDMSKRRLDFVGFNYYFTNYFDGYSVVAPEEPHNDLGWYMEPAGVGDVATKLWIRYKKPVMITENGLADEKDEHRQWWLKETMISLAKAQKAGAELLGYMHWSLLDNFEWAYGWWPKFGLVAVDRENGMKRTVRPSAKWWAEQIKALRINQDQ